MTRTWDPPYYVLCVALPKESQVMAPFYYCYRCKYVMEFWCCNDVERMCQLKNNLMGTICVMRLVLTSDSICSVIVHSLRFVMLQNLDKFPFQSILSFVIYNLDLFF